jgi:hypothetical protein
MIMIIMTHASEIAPRLSSSLRPALPPPRPSRERERERARTAAERDGEGHGRDRLGAGEHFPARRLRVPKRIARRPSPAASRPGPACPAADPTTIGRRSSPLRELISGALARRGGERRRGEREEAPTRSRSPGPAGIMCPSRTRLPPLGAGRTYAGAEKRISLTVNKPEHQASLEESGA